MPSAFSAFSAVKRRSPCSPRESGRRQPIALAEAAVERARPSERDARASLAPGAVPISARLSAPRNAEPLEARNAAQPAARTVAQPGAHAVELPEAHNAGRLVGRGVAHEAPHNAAPARARYAVVQSPTAQARLSRAGASAFAGLSDSRCCRLLAVKPPVHARRSTSRKSSDPSSRLLL